MARQFTRGRGRLGSTRQTTWIGITPTRNSIAAASTSVLVASLNAAALLLRPFTIVRTRAFWSVRSDQDTADETFGAAVGMAVVSTQASAIGVTAVPTPETDQGSELFFLYELLMGEAIIGAGSENQNLLTQQIDSKAMRRVSEGEDLVVVLETPAIASSGLVQLGGRMLLKLH